jgi:orotidine-5'-phosphate decarboxylase
MGAPRPQERVIVALDVPSASDALGLVEKLGDLVSFYKVGLELLMAGGIDGLLRTLATTKKVFVDFKLPDDIPATVRAAVRVASGLGVEFLTLSHSASQATIRAALEGRGEKRAPALPKLLFVPVLSSVDRGDFARATGRAASEFGDDVVRRSVEAKSAGVDGFIVSGEEIRLLRERFPTAPLVSPGIRPSWAASDDHKRACTPSEAIRWGADFIVVGRPIRQASSPRDAAQRIVDEIADAAASSPRIP